jgi:hypothetical protein
MKKKFSKQSLFQSLKDYIREHGLIEFSMNTVNEEQLIFALGSLIYPKQMLKMFDSSYNRSKAKILRRDISDEWGMDGQRVIQVYHYLYRFSIDRLYSFREDPLLLVLFKYYSQNSLAARIKRNPTMRKYEQAYLEAA